MSTTSNTKSATAGKIVAERQHRPRFDKNIDPEIEKSGKGLDMLILSQELRCRKVEQITLFDRGHSKFMLEGADLKFM